MANKYVDIGATYNGDGTTSAQAASAGAAGAWNNLRNVCLGTPGYGTLAAGDKVYVRTAAAGTGKIETWAATTVATGATSASPIDLIFDNGTVWNDGNSSGVFTVTHTGAIIWDDYVNVIGTNFNIKFYYNQANSASIMTFANARYDKVSFATYVSNTAYGQFYSLHSAQQGHNLFNDCKWDVGCAFQNTAYPILKPGSNYGPMSTFNGCIFNLANATATAGFYWIGECVYGGNINFNGCKWTNTRVSSDYLLGAITGAGGGNTMNFNQCDTGNLYLTPGGGYTNLGVQKTIITQKNATHDFIQILGVGSVEWKGGQNYPTLNATLPNGSSTYWSWKIYPAYNILTAGYPLPLPIFNKYFTQTSATKTATLEFLVNNAFGTPTKRQVWAEISYIDTDGNIQNVSTFDIEAANCDTSTAGWSSTTYGALSYSKFELSVTLTNLKQYSNIVVNIYVAIPSTSANDFFFFDPELTLS